MKAYYYNAKGGALMKGLSFGKQNEARGRLQRELDRLIKKYAPRNPRRARKNFKWITSTGEALSPRDMATPHLFYSLRMLWNNTVPPVFRIGTFRRRPAVETWPADYLKQAGEELMKELQARTDVDTPVSDTPGDTIRQQLFDLSFNTEILLALKNSGALDSVGK